MDKLPRTIFCDIDGTLLYYLSKFEDVFKRDNIPSLGESAQKLRDWYNKGDIIILTTARPESMRSITEKQLRNEGIPFHQMIMNLTNGVRLLVNDYTDESGPKAIAYNVRRNVEGLDHID